MVYPNRCGKRRDDDNRGALRVGLVEENRSTEASGLAGYLAAVTHEENGEARFYVWTVTPEQVLSWTGPYQAHSEEIVPLEGAL